MAVPRGRTSPRRVPGRFSDWRDAYAIHKQMIAQHGRDSTQAREAKRRSQQAWARWIGA